MVKKTKEPPYVGFTICYADDLNELENEVQACMDFGWELHSGLQVILKKQVDGPFGGDESEMAYIQAMKHRTVSMKG